MVICERSIMEYDKEIDDEYCVICLIYVDISIIVFIYWVMDVIGSGCVNGVFDDYMICIMCIWNEWNMNIDDCCSCFWE